MAAQISASKKPAAKKATGKAAAGLPSTIPDSSGFQVLRLTSKAPEVQDLVPLFEIDGVEYSVPRSPRANIALKYLSILEERGPELASVFIFRSMLGDDGYRALSDCDSLTGDHLEWLLETLSGLVMGTQEAPKA